MHHPGGIWDRNQTRFEQDQLLSSVMLYPEIPDAVPGNSGRHDAAHGRHGPLQGQGAGASGAEPVAETEAPSTLIPRGAVLQNLHGLPGLNYLSADAAVLLLSLKPETDLAQHMAEEEFLSRMYFMIFFNFMILDHFSRFFSSSTPSTRAVKFVLSLLSDHAGPALAGACNPMACLIRLS